MAIAAFGIAIAALIFRPMISDALSARGDDFLRTADLASAERYYRRSVAVDSENEAAIDRLALTAVETHEPLPLRRAVAFADRYLRRHPDNQTIRLDRALALSALGSHREARVEFLRLGLLRER